MKKMITTTILGFLFVVLQAQEPQDPMAIIMKMVEEIANTNDDETDFEQLYEQFANLLENPINVNTATRNDLEKLCILTDFQISSILDYIKTNGKMLSIYELAAVYGLDQKIVESIYPFVTVDVENVGRYDTASIQQMIKYGRHQIILRAKQTVEKQWGYKKEAKTKFEGSPLALYSRYSYVYANRLKWNLTTEKDAGEKYFDYVSAHIQYDSKKTINRLILGDFQAQFGQGLVLWNGFTMGKSAIGTTAGKRARGIYGYSSTDENKYFRGIAACLDFKTFKATIFVSHKGRDANIADSSGKSFSSLQTSGFHRTKSEIDDKNSIKETAIGGNISFEYKTLRIGTTALWHRFNADFVRIIQPYTIFEINKSSNYNYSVDAQWSWRRAKVFAETAFDADKNNASLVGTTFFLEQNTDVSLLYRNYARDYKSFYANGFGDATKTMNEEGFFAAISFSPLSKIRISGYFDVFKFPWLKFGVNSPSRGYSFYVNAEYALSIKTKMYVSVNNRNKIKNFKDNNDPITKNTEYSKLNVRYNINYVLFDKLNMQTRAEYSIYDEQKLPKEKGYSISQDFTYKFESVPINISLRYAYFDTDSWNTRIYSYESDMLYAFSVPSYYKKGSRWYFNIAYGISKNIKIWLRAAQTIYRKCESIGSGISKINGNKQTDVKMQIIAKF